jgi:S1-C subfamily serine protease
MEGMDYSPPEAGGAFPPLPPPPPPLGAAGAPSAPPGPRRGRALVAAVLAAMVLLAMGIGVGLGSSVRRTDRPAPLVPSLPTSPGSDPSGGAATGGSNARAVAARVTPAVVDVNTFVRALDANGGTAEQPLGAGTGMILTSGGEILTNNHVVKGSTSIRVSISGRGSFSATVVGADITHDVALIQVQGVSGLPTVSIGDPSTLSVGQEVVAIGNALGKGGTPSATVGTVTGLGKTITARDSESGSAGAEQLQGMIETDAPIQPGDSGGALVNGSGQVVGMITAGTQSESQPGSAGDGFAIASDAALRVVNEIRAGQASSSIIIGPTGYIGVGIGPLDAATAAQAGLRTTSGALVAQVMPGTPAASAGIRRLSVITSVDGQTISTAESLGVVLHQHKPGDAVQVTWVDTNGTHSASLTLADGGPAA